MIQLNERQQAIVDIVKAGSPITGDDIADRLETTRSALRSDLDFLSQLGVLVARPRVGYCYNEGTSVLEIYKEMVELSVKDYQSVPVVANQDSTAYDAMVSLFMNNVGSLCIVDNEGHLNGMVSRKDLLKLSLSSTDIHKIPISVIMTRMPNIIMTTSEESLWHAAKKLIDHEIDTLPVTVEKSPGKYEVTGRLTKTNVTRAFVDLGYGSLEKKYDV